ncbi:hypothetical protein [Kaistella carnis]|uniref:hypothetical protein n=1 Tax=Kaistella carnis TaxID=1241979 RepID=UPI002898A603|nr:hypothetical protein [Kaistella carnis]
MHFTTLPKRYSSVMSFVNLSFKNNSYFMLSLQPDLNGALFNWGLRLSKSPIKKAGVEGGIVCPNTY